MLSFSKGVDLAKYDPNVDAIFSVEPLRQASVFEALYAGVVGQAVLVKRRDIAGGGTKGPLKG